MLKEVLREKDLSRSYKGRITEFSETIKSLDPQIITVLGTMIAILIVIFILY